MSYSPNFLKGNIWGIILGTTIGLIKGHTRSLDNGTSGVTSQNKRRLHVRGQHAQLSISVGSGFEWGF